MTARASFRRSSMALTVALILPPLAWYGAQQGLGYVVRLQCAAAVGPGALAGAFALLACAAAAWLAVGVRRDEPSPPGRADSVRRAVAVLGAGVFALAIAFQTLAVLIVPSCAR